MSPRPSLKLFSARPSTSSDWLIFFASSSCTPDDSVLPCRSLPARSTSVTVHSVSRRSTASCSCDTVNCTMECDRLLTSFIRVSAVCRFALPTAMSSCARSGPSTECTLAPLATTRRFTSCSSRLSGSCPRARGASRSRTRSMYTSRYDMVTLTVRSASASTRACAARNISRTKRGTRPSASGPSPPWMLCVLPLPVCPYAKRHTLNPLSASSTIGRPIVSNTSACPPVNTWSKAKLRPRRPSSTRTVFGASGSASTTTCASSGSARFGGRTRTATVIRLAAPPSPRDAAAVDGRPPVDGRGCFATCALDGRMVREH
mmetsp:Transcript_54104/g.166471  ORF Transcript_54104/g.166471 Transcript_54104/m.166471 type:complete len:317 (+) Transcript_54104:995-1945(+)